MSTPNIAVVIEPAKGDHVVFEPVAGKDANAPAVGLLDLVLTITNHADPAHGDPPIHLTKVTVAFPGTAVPGNPTAFFAPLSAAELATLATRGVNATQANDGLAFVQSLTGVVARTGDQTLILPKIDWNVNSGNSFALSYNHLRWKSPAGVQTAATVANGVGTGSRPDLVGDPNGSHSFDVSGVRGPLLFNPDAYAIPTGLTFGNVGRNTLAGPGRINFDFGLFKRFSFGETRALDFRWENFNIFNHTQYNGVNTSMDGTSDFLHASGAHLARRMQFGLRFQF